MASFPSKVWQRHRPGLPAERTIPPQRSDAGGPGGLPPLRPGALAGAREVHP